MTYLVTVLEQCNPQHLRVVPAVVRLAVVSQNKDCRDTLVPQRDMEYAQETQEHSLHSAVGMVSL